MNDKVANILYLGVADAPYRMPILSVLPRPGDAGGTPGSQNKVALPFHAVSHPLIVIYRLYNAANALRKYMQLANDYASNPDRLRGQTGRSPAF